MPARSGWAAHGAALGPASACLGASAGAVGSSPCWAGWTVGAAPWAEARYVDAVTWALSSQILTLAIHRMIRSGMIPRHADVHVLCELRCCYLGGREFLFTMRTTQR